MSLFENAIPADQVVEIHWCKGDGFFNNNHSSLTRLEKMIYRGRFFEEIPSSFCQLSSLTDLEIHMDGQISITRVPKNIGTITSLTKLVINRPFILESLELPNLKNLKHLQFLTLDGLGLRHFPEEVQEMPLKELSLRSNFLTTIGPLKLPTTLEKVDLSFNDIITFLLGTTSIKRLNLEGNELTNLPEEVKAYDLKILNIEGNRFEILPQVLLLLTTLNELNIAKNPWGENETISLSHMSSLKSLTMQLTKEPFQLPIELESFIAADSYSHEVPINIMPPILSSSVLTHLDLTNCGLVAVPPEICSQTSLTSLVLSNNPFIKEFPEGFAGLSLQYLNVLDTFCHVQLGGMTSLKKLETTYFEQPIEGNEINLTHLTCVVAEKTQLDYLATLTILQTLNIYTSSEVDTSQFQMQSLTLENFHLYIEHHPTGHIEKVLENMKKMTRINRVRNRSMQGVIESPEPEEGSYIRLASSGKYIKI